MTIDIRTFTRFIYKHLKEGSYVVTKHGKPYLVVTIKPIIGTIEKDVVTIPRDNVVTYGCGCTRLEGKTLCPKHKRV